MEESVSNYRALCPLCAWKGGTREDWIKHMHKFHPEIGVLRLGKEKIDLKQKTIQETQ